MGSFEGTCVDGIWGEPLEHGTDFLSLRLAQFREDRIVVVPLNNTIEVRGTLTVTNDDNSGFQRLLTSPMDCQSYLTLAILR